MCDAQGEIEVARHYKLSRRKFVATTAAASATMIAAPFVRTAGAAGKLSIGFWDHWVPGANNATKTLVEEWAAKEKVEVQMDFIPSQGNKLLLTISAEAQAKSGHDVIAMSTWLPAEHARNLEPVNDVMDELIKQNGNVNDTVQYLGKIDGKWVAVPATVGSQIKGPCSRIDLMKQHAGIDVQALYPAGQKANADSWTLDVFLKAAEACHKAGHPFGIGLGTTADNVDTAGAIFHSYGAVLVDAKEKILVKSDPVREALDYYKRLMQFLPPDVAGMGRCLQQQVAGGRQGCVDHEPAERLGRGQARCAPGCRAAVDAWHAGGTEGPICPVRELFLGDLEFRQEQVGGKEPARPPLPALLCRKNGGSKRWLRHPLVREVPGLQDLG